MSNYTKLAEDRMDHASGDHPFPGDLQKAQIYATLAVAEQLEKTNHTLEEIAGNLSRLNNRDFLAELAALN